jgi:predicted DNA binding CopG/RHH family protein
MNYNQEQEKEIETIKERTITLKLSDADCERISKLTGKNGLTVGVLLENFIGDLVTGTYSNGSDEREYAQRWFERCGFEMSSENTLLKHLLECGYDTEDIEDFIIACDEIEYYKTHEEEYEEELQDAKEKGKEMTWFEKDFHNYTDKFIENNKDVDIDKEIELCRKWLTDFQKLSGSL